MNRYSPYSAVQESGFGVQCALVMVETIGGHHPITAPAMMGPMRARRFTCPMCRRPMDPNMC